MEPKAEKFFEWKSSSNLLIFDGEKSGLQDQGYYSITIKLEDNFATAVIPDYVECKDR